MIPCPFIDFFINLFINSQTHSLWSFEIYDTGFLDAKDMRKKSAGVQHCIKRLTAVFALDFKSIPWIQTTGSQTHCYRKGFMTTHAECPAGKPARKTVFLWSGCSCRESKMKPVSEWNRLTVSHKAHWADTLHSLSLGDRSALKSGLQWADGAGQHLMEHYSFIIAASYEKSLIKGAGTLMKKALLNMLFIGMV